MRQLLLRCAAAPALACALMILTIMAYAHFAGSLQQRTLGLERSQRDASSLDTRLQALRSAAPQIRLDAETFASLSARGVIHKHDAGSPDGLFARIAADMQFDPPVLRVARPPVTPDSLLPEQFGIHRQAFTLELKLWHEADLFDFLQALAEEAPALIATPRCHLQRRTQAGDVTPHTVAAACMLEWLSLSAKEARE